MRGIQLFKKMCRNCSCKKKTDFRIHFTGMVVKVQNNPHRKSATIFVSATYCAFSFTLEIRRHIRNTRPVRYYLDRQTRIQIILICLLSNEMTSLNSTKVQHSQFDHWGCLSSRKQVRVTNTPLHPTFI